MKKTVSFILLCAMLLAVCSCGGKTAGAAVIDVDSEIYTKKEILAAVKVAESYFSRHFAGCTLTEIYYAGDESTEQAKSFAVQYGADEAIILKSTFNVDESGASPSLNPGSTYKNWMWILVRNGKGAWKHVDHGYG